MNSKKTTLGYTVNDIATAVGESARKISYWSDIGLLVPDLTGPRAQGKTRQYALSNILNAAMIKVMKDDYSLSLSIIRGILDVWRKKGIIESIFYINQLNREVVSARQPLLPYDGIFQGSDIPCYIVVDLAQIVKIARQRITGGYVFNLGGE